MTKKPALFARNLLDAVAWDACVAAAGQPVLYGYSWYLDAVLPAPNWRWMGLVLRDGAGQYVAVMPVPLRRKTVFGLPVAWVVHQPFFCQFLGIFSRDDRVDAGPFYRLILEQFRYGSLHCTQQPPNPQFLFDSVRVSSTHTLNLSVGYPALYRRYTADRKANLRRAEAANWTLEPSGNLDPLLALFQGNQANNIEGGVAGWAYALLRNLTNELQMRGLATLWYARREGRGSIEAGVLFVQQGNRIIYLFNAASEAGRNGNARTLMLDRLIRAKAGQALVFDFESPEKPSIRDFYRSFGAIEEPYYALRWNRLSTVERALLRVRAWLAD